MRKYFFSFLCTVLFLYWGCSSSLSYRRYQYLKDPSTAGEDTLITLERTGCTWGCPSYRVWIASRGKVMYEGLEFVDKIGLGETFINPDSVAKLINSFLSSNYFSFPDTITKCIEYWKDSPITITSLRLGKRFKQVVHYEGCIGFQGEADLHKLKNEINRIAKTKRWTGNP